MARTGVVQRRLKPPTGPPSWFRETVGLGNPPGFQPRLAGRQVAQAAAAGHARSRCLAGAHRLRLPTRRT